MQEPTASWALYIQASRGELMKHFYCGKASQGFSTSKIFSSLQKEACPEGVTQTQRELKEDQGSRAPCLPSPSSTTARMTTGNTPRSKSKFSWGKENEMRLDSSHQPCLETALKTVLTSEQWRSFWQASSPLSQKDTTEQKDWKPRHQLSKEVSQNNGNIDTLPWHWTPAMASKAKHLLSNFMWHLILTNPECFAVGKVSQNISSAIVLVACGRIYCL